MSRFVAEHVRSVHFVIIMRASSNLKSGISSTHQTGRPTDETEALWKPRFESVPTHISMPDTTNQLGNASLHGKRCEGTHFEIGRTRRCRDACN